MKESDTKWIMFDAKPNQFMQLTSKIKSTWKKEYTACKTYRLDHKKTFPFITGNTLETCPGTSELIF